jgi:hypothetical protein
MITKARLQEIEDILNVVTEGEWVTDIKSYQYPDDDPVVTTANGAYIAQTVYDGQSSTQEHNVVADTLFIAASKTIVSELLIEVKRLKIKCGEIE